MRRLSMAHPQMVRYYPNTGRVEPCYEPNPVPQRAIEAHDSKRGVQGGAARAALLAGIGRIDWDEVLAVDPEKLQSFVKAFELSELIIENTKISKPRPSGRFAKTKGLNLSPHFFPNLLHRVGLVPVTVGEWTWQVPEPNTKNEVAQFDGTSNKTAFESVNRDLPEPQRIKRVADLLNFCTGSSDYCRSSCLIFSGQNIVAKGPAAKMRRTYALLAEPVLFVAALKLQMKAFARNCAREGKDAVVRLNLLSDLPWYMICPDLLLHFDGSSAEQPLITFYDYTKTPYFWETSEYQRVKHVLDLTFSYSGQNADQAKAALEAGYRVAVVFAPMDPNRSAQASTRTTFREILSSGLVDKNGDISLFDGKWELIDGDESDYRADDPAPCIVALNFKDPNLPFERQETKKRTKKAYQPREKGVLKPAAAPSAEELQLAKEVAIRLGESVRSSRAKFGFQVPKTDVLDLWNQIRVKKWPWSALLESDESIFPELTTDDFAPESLIRIYEEYVKRKKSNRGGSEQEIAESLADMVRELAAPHQRRARPNSSSQEEVAVTMTRIPGTNLLMGPHVPVITNDK